MDLTKILKYSRKLKVLYVEDDKEVCESTRGLLLNYFNHIDTAHDGKEALNKYFNYKSKNNNHYDLVITDIGMPKIDGIKMSKKIINENPEQSIILVTSKDDVSYLYDAIALGVDGFLHKPLNLKKLNKLLLKTTKAIHQHKESIKHYENIESLNNKLSEYAESLEKKVKKRTEALNHAKEKAEEETKVKSEFLAHMNHELRTPLNAIIGFSHILKEINDIPDKSKNFIDKIHTSGNNLLKLINNILDISKLEAKQVVLEKRELDLYALVQSVIDQQELKAEQKGLKLFINFEESITKKFYGDSLRIYQILTNLLSNAIKFTENGEVSICIKKIGKNIIRFETTDTGVGLSKKQLSRLFQPFSQADETISRKYGGTGLGLTISKQLIELMDGKIWVESEEGIGSKFIFEIVLKELGIDKDNIATKIQSTNLKEKVNKIKKTKILLVEDNKTNQLLIQSILEDSSIAIDIANNGKEAIEKFQVNQYKLILMDIVIPILNGYEATKIIRDLDANIPIIALSANVIEKDVIKCKDLGMNEYLSKPVDINKLYLSLLRYL